MKSTFFMAAAALFLSASVHAQSTVDSIEAKYTLLPMPGQLTIEQTFPAIGTYQLNNSTNTTTATADNNVSTAGNLTVALDSVNKGIIWIEGLPQGRIKAYLKQSPATYRILSQKTASGEQVPEGTLVYDSTTHIINIALGTPYNEADPAGIFASNPANADMTMNTTADANMQANDNNVTKEKTKVESNTVKHKTKTTNGKTKSKVTYYTGTKVMMNNMNSDMNNMNHTGNMNNTDNTNQQPSQTTPSEQQPQAPKTQPQQQPQGNPQQQ